MNTWILTHIDCSKIETKDFYSLKKLFEITWNQDSIVVFKKWIFDCQKIIMEGICCFVEFCCLLWDSLKTLAETLLHVISYYFTCWSWTQTNIFRKTFGNAFLGKVSFFKEKKCLNQLRLDVTESTTVRFIFTINRCIWRMFRHLCYCIWNLSQAWWKWEWTIKIINFFDIVVEDNFTLQCCRKFKSFCCYKWVPVTVTTNPHTHSNRCWIVKFNTFFNR